jgi:hypothetical protein
MNIKQITTIGLISGAASIALAALPAVTPVISPETQIDFSSNPYIGALSFCTVIASSCMWFAYKQLQAVIALTRNNSKLESSIERLCDNLNSRPCILGRPLNKKDE